jgi:hypothetical protein
MQPFHITYSITLSDEELSVLLTYAGIPRILGFTPLTLNDDTVQIVVRALVARSVLVVKDGSYVIDPLVIAIIGSGTTSPNALMIHKMMGTDAPSVLWVYLTSEFFVTHLTENTGIHRFGALPSGVDLLVLLATYLELNMDQDSVPAPQTVVVERAVWEKVSSALEANERQSAGALLRQRGVAEQFAADVEICERLHMIGGSSISQVGENSFDGGLVISALGRHWIITPEMNSITAVTASAQNVLDDVAALLLLSPQ